ncbi:MAG TPA: DUF6503 family protein [Chitinophagaceae bacterium]|nr:DUF6503 family protein [Chitinophagaceae bacterium]
MIKIILIFSIVILSSFKLNDNAGKNLLKKVIAYHDPKGNWAKLKAKFYLSNTSRDGKENNFELELDNKTGYFCHISHKDGKEIVKGFSNGKEFFLVDNKKDFTEDDKKKYKLNNESVKGIRNFYGYLYGLPMKLKDAGVNVDETVNTEEVDGKTYPTIRVSYDPAVGKDNWFFYCDPQTSALKAYRFNHGKPESGEYILLDQEININGIRLPKIRKWYLNKDNKYLGTDNLLKAEKLISYRM